jgi:hypothetical protein
MAVSTVSRFRANPGKQAELMALLTKAKAMHVAAGGKVRVWTATIAGPDTGSVSYVIEHKTMAAYAKFVDKMAADAKWQAFIAKAQAAPISQILSSALITEAAI